MLLFYLYGFGLGYFICMNLDCLKMLLFYLYEFRLFKIVFNDVLCSLNNFVVILFLY